MINKKHSVLVCLTFTVLVILFSSTIYAQTSGNANSTTDSDENKPLPLSNWNESKLSEFHYSPQIKTRLNQTFYPLQAILGGKIDKAEENKTWDANPRSVFHYAADIKVKYKNSTYSLQELIDHKGIKVRGGEDFPATSKSKITEWDESDHLVWHGADEIRVNIKKILYSLQYAIDQGLIKFPRETNKTRNVTILEFSVPAGSSENYERSCYKRDVNSANLKDAINASSLIPGAVYSVSCSYDGGPQLKANKVKFNGTYVQFFDAEEDHVSRIIRILNRDVLKGKDTFVWEGNLDQAGELSIRIRRAESCSNRPGLNFDITKCTVNRRELIGGLLGIELSTNNNENTFENLDAGINNNPFQTISTACCCDSTDIQGCYAAPNRGRCTGPVCGISCSAPNAFACGNSNPSSGVGSGSDSGGLFGGALSDAFDCSNAWRLTYGLKCTEYNFCPIYKVPVGIGPGIVRNEDIYAWKKLDCKVITQR